MSFADEYGVGDGAFETDGDGNTRIEDYIKIIHPDQSVIGGLKNLINETNLPTSYTQEKPSFDNTFFQEEKIAFPRR